MYFITLSRQLGTKGTEIAKLVAKELHYDFYDTEAIEKKAGEMGFLDDIRKVDDKPPSPLKQLFSWQTETCLEHLYTVIYDLSRYGNAVVLGRGGNMLFRPIPHALHVRVIASHEKRVQNLLEKVYRRETAVMIMEKSDQERSSFIRFAFNRDWGDPELYDMVLNMDNMTVRSAADTILRAARLRESQCPSRDGMSPLNLMELTAKVKAALANAGFPSNYASPFVNAPGKVRLTGIVHDPREKLAAEMTALKVEGVESVENRIQIAGS
ncbi:cytidylate kinase family protein [Syntrophus aciditrophicus]|uniref:Bon domain protein n=1 Tax=Syntrophus aciditrophicus (strain SB) TaxID=56780 RepID=Q2LW13_SYNAS|nr:cytidylate kinase family protein [Syntrophus aciditrophicus]ABC78276.1 bon domain protein [Syntrophus aciditrophicus SB]OPY18425.1 MAG: BON domain protein [Syntrophus sp. PtaB.Bin075]